MHWLTHVRMFRLGRPWLRMMSLSGERARSVALGMVGMLATLGACAGQPEDGVSQRSEAVQDCGALDATQLSTLNFEDAAKWSPTFANLSLSATHSQGASSLALTPTSGYVTLTSVALNTLPLTGRSLTLDVRVPDVPVNPNYIGNITGYLDVPSRGLQGVYLGYQQLSQSSGFQTLSFEIPEDAYGRLSGFSYSDLRIRFGLALPSPSSAYLLDNLNLQQSCPTATPLNACGELTTGGAYVLQSDLSGGECLNIHDVSGVQIDCANHLVSGSPPLSVTNAQNFSIKNCRLESPSAFMLPIHTSTTGTLSGNTIRVTGGGAAIATVDVYDSGGLSFDDNTLTGGYQQSYASNNVISNNHITAPSGLGSNFMAALVVSNFGQHTQVVGNTLDGGWDGTIVSGAPEFSSTDDGVIAQDDTDLLVQNNVIRNVFDCGFESSGQVSGATISGNQISTAGICGIGGWYWSSVSGLTVSQNTVDNSGSLLLFRRIFGLRPAGWDELHRMPADAAVLFRDNLFDGNIFTNPNTYSAAANAAANIPIYDNMGYFGGVSSIPGEREPVPPGEFQLTNNLFKNNRFGRVRAAPYFGGNAPVPGRVVDGGGNICQTPTSAGYPLNCN